MSRVAVLVTGGAGYIGSHVCKALAEIGFEPICFDNLEKGHDWAVRWGPLERGDIGDPRRLDEIFSRHRPHAVMHLAGYIEVGESIRHPDSYLNNNAAKSDTLIAAALRNKVEAFVFSSSCAVYGLPQTELLAETHPVLPINPYAESKALVEQSLTKAAASGLRALSLRYFNATGADCGGDIGEAHKPETHLLPLVADAVLGMGPELDLLGTDYPTADGTCIRDFVHVSDLAEAHTRALAWLQRTRTLNGGLHEIFNLGSGSGHSVKEVVAETARITGRPVPFRARPRRPGDSPRLVGDITKARRDLGWHPLRDLGVQIEDTLRWRRKMPR